MEEVCEVGVNRRGCYSFFTNNLDLSAVEGAYEAILEFWVIACVVAAGSTDDVAAFQEHQMLIGQTDHAIVTTETL